MSLTSEFIVHDQVLIVRLDGELDHHEADLLRSIWQQKLADNNVKHVILNLEGITFMDSSGIGVLLGRYKEITQTGGELILCSVQEQVKRIFDMSGLFKIIRLEKSEQIALDSLGVAL